MQPVKGEEEKEGEGRVKKVRQTDEYNQHLHKDVRTLLFSFYLPSFSLSLSLSLSSVQGTNPIVESRISLADFNILKVIGRGSYAKVLMVELKSTKRIYAMKVIKKDLVMDEEVSFLATNFLKMFSYESFLPSLLATGYRLGAD